MSALVNNDSLFQILAERRDSSAQVFHTTPIVMQAFADDFARRFCWSSNALEGNTLSLDETVSLIDYDEVRAGHTFSEYQEAKNLFRAIQRFLLPLGKKEISEEWVKRVNGELMETSGGYRETEVYIGNLAEAVYFPPNPKEVPSLMKAYMETANFSRDSIKEIFEEAALQHMRFERIHPFIDGNGRCGRVILNQQLVNNGMLPVSISARGKYRQAFRLFDRNGDISSMIHLLASAEIESMERVSQLLEKYGDAHSV